MTNGTTPLNFDVLMTSKNNGVEGDNDVLADDASTLPKWPSRQSDNSKSESMVQMTVRINNNSAEKFRTLCRSERYSYGSMLEILMNSYQK